MAVPGREAAPLPAWCMSRPAPADLHKAWPLLLVSPTLHCMSLDLTFAFCPPIHLPLLQATALSSPPPPSSLWAVPTACPCPPPTAWSALLPVRPHRAVRPANLMRPGCKQLGALLSPAGSPAGSQQLDAWKDRCSHINLPANHMQASAS